MKLYIINGPNLNMLGIREPDIYGKEDYDHLIGMIGEYAAKKNIEAECFQSNHEGALVDKIQEAYFKGADGIVINPGAYTHTSIAIMDAVKSVMLPAVEVHISNLANREEFRHISYIRKACIDSVIGEGLQGYLHAIDILEGYINARKD
ncbi:MAG: type II 3-dehydroquinate dehydratase [Lachnospiraceae bacterium]|nr:type II 3-dehydroquinate dehydratase [Lachnospiraceae bacterium]MBQ7260047.1 type II 3-dehydroquinate dehydratase [Lachnospiraceae bacterium]HAU99975.1 type II 3-dehydroquinate dehydratase [Lachnospiraceae bacterium]